MEYLDDVVRDVKSRHPFSGFALLKSRGINIQRYRLQESIKRIDPIRTSARWHQVVHYGILMAIIALFVGDL